MDTPETKRALQSIGRGEDLFRLESPVTGLWVSILDYYFKINGDKGYMLVPVIKPKTFNEDFH